ncbi:hypothetical protein BN1263490033 [Stenotrophomonas indicatrix]|nr:hypothetical protein BN1263490033 [Stenotrophomonas indicatrix]
MPNPAGTVASTERWFEPAPNVHFEREPREGSMADFPTGTRHELRHQHRASPRTLCPRQRAGR